MFNFKAQQSLIQASQFMLQAMGHLSDAEPTPLQLVAAPPAPVKRGRKPGPQKTAPIAAKPGIVKATPKTVAKAATALEAKELAPEKKKLGRPPNAKPQSQPQPKVKVKAKAAKAKAAKGTAASAADSTEGKLPTLTERLKTVIGGDEVGISEAIKRLKARGKKWVPNSGDLQAYISVAMSTHKEDFVRVKRGIYRVRKAAVAKATAAKATAGKPTVGKKVKAAKVKLVKVETLKTPPTVETEPTAVEVQASKVEKIDKADKADKAVKKVKRQAANGLVSEDHGDLGNVLDNPFSP